MSSRVLKPPGGGHSNIFAPPEEKTRQPRPKNNQQNSEMMGEIMGKAAEPVPEKVITHEPAPAPQNNVETVTTPEAISKPIESVAPTSVEFSASKQCQESTPVVKNDSCPARTKVPPGGFSAGFW